MSLKYDDVVCGCWKLLYVLSMCVLLMYEVLEVFRCNFCCTEWIQMQTSPRACTYKGALFDEGLRMIDAKLAEFY